MRPKYSSPGAEALYSWHCKCAHLLFVSPHGSFFFDGDGVAAGAAACVLAAPGARNAPAIVAAASNANSVRLTCEISALGSITRMNVERFPPPARLPSC